jgi:hypothetical protein
MARAIHVLRATDATPCCRSRLGYHEDHWRAVFWLETASGDPGVVEDVRNTWGRIPADHPRRMCSPKLNPVSAKVKCCATITLET